MTPMAKCRKTVLAGVLWVVAIPWLVPGAHAQEVQSLASSEELATFVTFRVETAEGKWMRFTTREHQTAVMELLRTGERFGLTPILGSGPDDLEIEVTRLDVPKRPDAPVVERLTAKLGFPSFLAEPSLLRVDVETVEIRRVPARAGLSRDLLLSPKGRTSEDFEFEQQCCVTCDGITGCGCFVGASCGSCCDCCGPRAN